MLKEDLFLDFVIRKAESVGKLFILDSGEGNGFIDNTTGWYIEDLSGWLINPRDREKLLEARRSGAAYSVFSDSYVFAEWSKSENNTLDVQFRKY